MKPVSGGAASVTPRRNRKEPAMLDPLGSGLAWQQFLAVGLVAAFVGTVRVLDLLYRSGNQRRRGDDYG